MFKKIVIIEPINMLDVHKKMLNEYALEVVAYDSIPTSDEEKIKRIADADCLLVSYTSSIDEYVINKVPNLKYIGMCCSLYSKESANVDIAAAELKGITVKGIRDYGDAGVAEYVIYELVKFLEGYDGLKWDSYAHEITNKNVAS